MLYDLNNLDFTWARQIISDFSNLSLIKKELIADTQENAKNILGLNNILTIIIEHDNGKFGVAAISGEKQIIGLFKNEPWGWNVLKWKY